MLLTNPKATKLHLRPSLMLQTSWQLHHSWDCFLPNPKKYIHSIRPQPNNNSQNLQIYQHISPTPRCVFLDPFHSLHVIASHCTTQSPSQTQTFPNNLHAVNSTLRTLFTSPPPHYRLQPTAIPYSTPAHWSLVRLTLVALNTTSEQLSFTIITAHRSNESIRLETR